MRSSLTIRRSKRRHAAGYQNVQHKLWRSTQYEIYPRSIVSLHQECEHRPAQDLRQDSARTATAGPRRSTRRDECRWRRTGAGKAQGARRSVASARHGTLGRPPDANCGCGLRCLPDCGDPTKRLASGTPERPCNQSRACAFVMVLTLAFFYLVIPARSKSRAVAGRSNSSGSSISPEPGGELR